MEKLVTLLNQYLESGSLIAFGVVFLAGIITSLTPCIYPLIPIVASYTGSRAEKTAVYSFFVSVFYVLGLAVTFAFLGVLASLGGKVFGIYLTGVAQVGILILASAVFFQVKWGDPLGTTALILAAVFGATGWGMLITAFARNPSQVASVGTAIMLIFGILGGSFLNLEQMPAAVQTFSKVTPNAWAMDGFTPLALGGGLRELTEPILALLVMGAILFAIAVIIFGKKNLAQK